jgi:predicted ATPase
MVVSIYLRHFKIYKGINFIPLSIGHPFTSIIGENGVGKSSVLEALDFVFNKKEHKDWPVNNEAKYEGGIKGSNIPFVAPILLIKKTQLRNSKKEDQELFDKATILSNFLWSTEIKTKAKGFDEFYKHRDELSRKFDKDEYLLILIGKKHLVPGIYFGSFHNALDFVPEIEGKNKDVGIQIFFKGFYDYVVSHYSYLHIPVETDAFQYTKLETAEMQKLMDKNIQNEIENAITIKTIKSINVGLGKFVEEIEKTLCGYQYKGNHKDNLTMPDLVSKIIEAYFSIKVLNKKSDSGRLVPVNNLSSGEKRRALIDVAYSFLLRDDQRDKNIILAIDEPEASLHISSCFNQFEKLMNLANQGHQMIISTHWYGYLPITSRGSATSIQKDSDNNISINLFDLYNYREQILHARKQYIGPLPYDINLKSYNDLVQSIVFSLIADTPYNWIICEGLSEKIYFENLFEEQIKNNNLRILPVGGFKEVKKIYENLISPINDPDYNVKGKVLCLIDTDKEVVKVTYKKHNHLQFFRLLNEHQKESIIIDVDSAKATPPTEIEDCLEPVAFYKTLELFSLEDQDLKELLDQNPFFYDAKNSGESLDLRQQDLTKLKAFFDKYLGENKINFARKYMEILKTIKDPINQKWINQIKNYFS